MTEQQMSSVERLLEYSSLEVERNLDDVAESDQPVTTRKNAGRGVCCYGKDTKRTSGTSGEKPIVSKPKANPAAVSELTSAAAMRDVILVGGGGDAGWPSRGEIEFRNVHLRYREDLPFALKDLSFKIKGGERCGIVGKTGGGKSSLFVCLLRLVDCSQGEIFFDGVDIRTVSKRRLRSSVTIVPQDPVVFKGTLRYNLDPFNERTDAEVWAALQASHIARIAESSEHKLNLPIADNGSNFSVGERALICMARAILRKSKIVALDEASSSLDANTDVLIQKTIREQFNDSTLLVIAHRLDTVIDLDTVLVMGEGKMIEKDTAHALLSRKDSAFSVLVEETGPTNALFLRQRAAEVATQRRENPSAYV